MILKDLRVQVEFSPCIFRVYTGLGTWSGTGDGSVGIEGFVRSEEAGGEEHLIGLGLMGCNSIGGRRGAITSFGANIVSVGA